MSERLSLIAKNSVVVFLMGAALSVSAAPTSAESVTAPTQTAAPMLNSGSAVSGNSVSAASPESTATVPSIEGTLAEQLQPTDAALSEANQTLLSRNAQLQRQVNDLQTQANVLVYESKGQLFLYGAFTVLISLLVGIFISWLVFVRRERW